MSNVTRSKSIGGDKERLDAIGELGDTLYALMRERLETERLGEYVAIHVDSGDHSVGKTSNLAVKSLLARHRPDGR